jgi:hypothetical protein
MKYIRSSGLSIIICLGVLVGAGLLWAGNCVVDLTDVNECGLVHPAIALPNTARLAYLTEDRGCCDTLMRQRLSKEWWDFNFDGIADCEYQWWETFFDYACATYDSGGGDGDPIP